MGVGRCLAGKRRNIAAVDPPPPGRVVSQLHSGIPNPEKQRRKGESHSRVVGISGDLIHLGDSDHTIQGKE